jgi:hypothetical protein
MINNVFNNYLNGTGRALHLIQDIQSTANAAGGHLGLLKIDNFAGMNTIYTHKGCDAINSELLEIARDSFKQQLAVLNSIHPSRECRVEEYAKVGIREKEDAGKTAYILQNVTEEEAQTCFEVVQDAMRAYIAKHHLDKLPNPKTGVAGVHILMSVAPIPPRCANRENALTLLAEHHNLINAQKKLAAVSHQPFKWEEQLAIWETYNPARTQTTINTLIEKHDNDPLGKAINIINLLTNDPPRAFVCPLPEQDNNPDEYTQYVIEASKLSGRGK